MSKATFAAATTLFKHDVDISGNLELDGTATLNSSLAVTGTSAFTGNATFTNDLTVNGLIRIDDIQLGSNTTSQGERSVFAHSADLRLEPLDTGYSIIMRSPQNIELTAVNGSVDFNNSTITGITTLQFNTGGIYNSFAHFPDIRKNSQHSSSQNLWTQFEALEARVTALE